MADIRSVAGSKSPLLLTESNVDHIRRLPRPYLAFARRDMRLSNQFANWLLIVAGALTIAVFVLRLLPSKDPTVPELDLIGVSAAMPPIKGISYEGKDSILFFLSSSCDFCRASAPLYREVLGHAKDSAIEWRTYAISADTEPVLVSYLEREALEFDRVVTSAPIIHGFPVVPIVTLVDRTGTVTGVWVGKLAPDEESALIAALQATRPG